MQYISNVTNKFPHFCYVILNKNNYEEYRTETYFQ